MDHMISNGIDAITQLARNSVFKQVYEDHREITFLDMVNGALENVTKSEPPISHTMFDIQSMIQFLEERSAASETPFIFVEKLMITCILDHRGFQVNRLCVPLSQSPILEFLCRLSTGQPKDVIRSLKYNLKSAILIPDPIPALQTLKFESSSSAEHQNRPTDEGVSSSLKSKVTGAAEIPEEFTVRFQMYPSIASELPENGDVEIRIELHVDPSAGTISVRPFPGSVESAVVAGMRHVKTAICGLIGQSLVANPDLVFLGKP